MLGVRNKRDFSAGLMLAGFGIAALLIARGYRLGTAAHMGPGYFPSGIAALLVIVGGIVAVRGLKGATAGRPAVAWRPLALVTIAVSLFGVLLNGGGLVLATSSLVVVGRAARPENTWRETFILCAVIGVWCAGVFYFGLGINVHLWPRLGRG
jgi:hypothetical protein